MKKANNSFQVSSTCLSYRRKWCCARRLAELVEWATDAAETKRGDAVSGGAKRCKIAWPMRLAMEGGSAPDTPSISNGRPRIVRKEGGKTNDFVIPTGCLCDSVADDRHQQ